MKYSEQNAYKHKEALNISQKIYSDFLVLRSNEKDFLLRHHPSYIDSHKFSAQLLTQDLDALHQLMQDSLNLTQEINSIKTELELYLNTFQDIVALQSTLGTTPEQGLYGQLRLSAHKLEHLFSENQQQHTMNLLLHIRKSEKDFILHPSKNHLETFNTQLKQLSQEVATNGYSQSLQAELKLYIKNYEKTFTRYANNALKKGESEHDGLQGTLRKQARNLEMLITAIKKDILHDSLLSEINTHSHARILSATFPLLVLLLALMPFILNMTRKEEKKY
tara:strand:- start:92235 stop:93068 length:834 start_codon:yes stop_codon:yes gene_type:complete